MRDLLSKEATKKFNDIQDILAVEAEILGIRTAIREDINYSRKMNNTRRYNLVIGLSIIRLSLFLCFCRFYDREKCDSRRVDNTCLSV